MDQIEIITPTSKYPIYFTESFSGLTSALENANLLNRKVCIITDDHVDDFYGNAILQLLQPCYNEVYKYVIKSGETNKNLNTVYNIYEFLISKHFDRDSFLIALGGGVTGDITGYVASTYMRGIPFVQVPTSLLAQVDSSVGGKVGVDFQHHKNIIGSFYHPRFVFVNPNVLKTLPKSEFMAGMGEVIKHGLILDSDYYNFIIKNRRGILSLDQSLLRPLIKRSCELKSQVVSQDEKEKGLREILNFGHTIGHAIETLSNFSYLHGECVSIGMVGAAYLSHKNKNLSKSDLSQIITLLNQYELPTHYDSLEEDNIYKQLFLDKKVKNNQLSFVLLSSIGEAYRTKDLSKKDIMETLCFLKKAVL